MTFNPVPKPTKKRNEKYLNIIRSKPCLISGQKAIAHHENGLLGERGMATKNDYCAVPLSPKYHNQQDDSIHGMPKTFWYNHNIDIKKEIMLLNQEYIELERKRK